MDGIDHRLKEHGRKFVEFFVKAATDVVFPDHMVQVHQKSKKYYAEIAAALTNLTSKKVRYNDHA